LVLEVLRAAIASYVPPEEILTDSASPKPTRRQEVRHGIAGEQRQAATACATAGGTGLEVVADVA
jgi:hypothetical protein